MLYPLTSIIIFIGPAIYGVVTRYFGESYNWLIIFWKLSDASAGILSLLIFLVDPYIIDAFYVLRVEKSGPKKKAKIYHMRYAPGYTERFSMTRAQLELLAEQANKAEEVEEVKEDLGRFIYARDAPKSVIKFVKKL